MSISQQQEIVSLSWFGKVSDIVSTADPQREVILSLVGIYSTRERRKGFPQCF